MKIEFKKGFKLGFEEFGQSIKDIVNFILLLTSYLIGVGISALISKFLFGKKFLKLNNKEDTNWTLEIIGNKKTDNYYRQF